MSWPLPTPLDGSLPMPEDFTRLLLRLGPDGYAQSLDATRSRELDAYAMACWLGAEAIARGSAQSLQSLTTQLLEEWEHAYGLLNDAARGIQARQARLIAAESATGGSQEARLNAALQAIYANADEYIVKRADVVAAAAQAHLIFQAACWMDDAGWRSPALRAAIGRVLTRTLPARCWFQDGVHEPEDALFVEEGADWDAGDRELGRDALDRDDAVTEAVRAPPCRSRDYGPLSKLRATDLNALQDGTLFAPCEGAGVLDTYPSAPAGARPVAFAASCTDLAVTTLDTSIDWRGRFVSVVLRHAPASDIRPGQAADSSFASGTQAQSLVWTGTGDSVALTGYRWTFATNLHLYADSSGNLVIQNATGAGTTFAVGIAVATGGLGV